MNIEAYRLYCLNKKGVTEGMPFGPDVLVFKVMGKMFALCDINTFASVNLKSEPERAIELREAYPNAILPGYHMNKAHWNTVVVGAGLTDQLFFELIDHSYQLIVEGLSRKLRAELDEMK